MSTQVLSKRLKTYWGIGALGVAILMNTGSFLVLAYLITVVKLSPALAGSILLFTKIIDAVSDPVMGYISDRSKFKSGRRRPYLFIGSFVSVIAFLLLFTMPTFESETAKAAYATAVLILYTLGYTIFNVPYMAMSAEMTDGYEERTKLHGVRVMFVSIGGSLVAGGGPLILQYLGRDWDAYATLGVVFSAILFSTMIACWFGTSEARVVHAKPSSYKFSEQLSLFVQNRHFLVVVITKLFQLLGVMSAAAVTLIFFMDYLRINLAYLSLFGITNTIATIIAVPLLIKFSEKFGKKNTYILSAAITICVNLSWALLPPDLDPSAALFELLIRAVAIGVIIAGNVMMAMSMLTDTIEYDALKTGMRREGLYASMYSFVEKFSGAFGPFLIGIILEMTGYDNSLTPGMAQSPDALEGIVIGVAYVPAFFTAVSIIVLLFYTLDKTELNKLRDEAKVKI